jgi:hypothetical protein
MIKGLFRRMVLELGRKKSMGWSRVAIIPFTCR